MIYKDDGRGLFARPPPPHFHWNLKMVTEVFFQLPITYRMPMKATIPRTQAPITSQPFIIVNSYEIGSVLQYDIKDVHPEI